MGSLAMVATQGPVWVRPQRRAMPGTISTEPEKVGDGHEYEEI